MEDPALETLFLPIVSGASPWPSGAPVLFLRARAGAPLREIQSSDLVCEQSFKPDADALTAAGLTSAAVADGETYPLVLVLPPRQREEARALLARAVRRAGTSGIVMASALNTEGARRLESDLGALASPVHSISKHKCRVFWTQPGRTAGESELCRSWEALDAPRPILDGEFLSRPGLFAWDHIDAGSALLAESLPDDLRGRGADLGAGFGFLAAAVLARCPKVKALDLYEAEARALVLAKLNLGKTEAKAALDFLWHDVTQGLSRSYDFIVSNPPFHEGRADKTALGRQFIQAAAGALVKGGRLLLVANRHLPYEATLAACFRIVRGVADRGGYKIIEAVK
ncbi:MAG: Methyltransferase small domain family [Rhodospirillales bacterium]|nr:Methyltransferase small domain family [Rhodospirillales bacterium]